jgi:hypothetical protein
MVSLSPLKSHSMIAVDMPRPRHGRATTTDPNSRDPSGWRRIWVAPMSLSPITATAKFSK